MDEKQLTDYLDEFVVALRGQLEDDQRRWGDTWKHRTREDQEQRIRQCFDNYFDQFEHSGVPVPWLKVAGNAMIAWVRDHQAEQVPL